MNASGLALRGFQAGLHSALALLERWSTFLRNPALIANPPENLRITVLFRGVLNYVYSPFPVIAGCDYSPGISALQGYRPKPEIL